MAHDHHNMMKLSESTVDPHHGMNHGDMKHGMSSQQDYTSMNMNHSMVMRMYFYASSEATILFKEWHVKSWQGMLGSCIAIFIIAILYEGLKVLRECLLKHSFLNGKNDNILTVPINANNNGGNSENCSMIQKIPPQTFRQKLITKSHILQTLLHLIQIVISYFLMLIFMTYNVWLCIAVAFGSTVGFFCFSWKRAIVVDINEHCH